MNEWISVKDRLPQQEITVLIFYRMHRKNEEGTYNYKICTAFFDDSNYLYDCWIGWIDDPDETSFGNVEIPLRFVTHWMPLPQPPGEK